ncbi:phosphatase PAP2 family protein [Cellulosimicrobium marinum]|uniref:phosphatase PAP2 family protein n=1 Tax=Cellulosimicrobium marinum TaxID=1638992 RepID=UPI001E65C9B3|nr:phosphatase PAP2 family protein [Cellulosimicrobium marinum]MCB7137055.1 phosphatase PAP2 family protein [Cellulosimicrobium marinum]
MDERRRRGAAGAATALVAFVLVYVVAVRTVTGQVADVRGFAQLQGGGELVSGVASVSRAVLPVVLAATCLVLGVLALRQHRVRDLVAAVLVAVLPLAVSGWLRDQVLVRPDLGDLGYAYNTMPSGHVSATVGLAAAMVLLTPRASRRTVAAVAVGVVVVACVASVVGHAHRPSDTLASVLLVGAVVGLVVAVLDVPTDR